MRKFATKFRSFSLFRYFGFCFVNIMDFYYGKHQTTKKSWEFLCKSMLVTFADGFFAQKTKMFYNYWLFYLKLRERIADVIKQDPKFDDDLFLLQWLKGTSLLFSLSMLSVLNWYECDSTHVSLNEMKCWRAGRC